MLVQWHGPMTSVEGGRALLRGCQMLLLEKSTSILLRRVEVEASRSTTLRIVSDLGVTRRLTRHGLRPGLLIWIILATLIRIYEARLPLIMFVRAVLALVRPGLHVDTIQRPTRRLYLCNMQGRRNGTEIVSRASIRQLASVAMDDERLKHLLLCSWENECGFVPPSLPQSRNVAEVYAATFQEWKGAGIIRQGGAAGY